MNKLERYQGVIKLLERYLHESYQENERLEEELQTAKTALMMYRQFEHRYADFRKQWDKYQEDRAKLNTALESLEWIRDTEDMRRVL